MCFTVVRKVGKTCFPNFPTRVSESFFRESEIFGKLEEKQIQESETFGKSKENRSENPKLSDKKTVFKDVKLDVKYFCFSSMEKGSFSRRFMFFKK